MRNLLMVKPWMQDDAQQLYHNHLPHDSSLAEASSIAIWIVSQDMPPEYNNFLTEIIELNTEFFDTTSFLFQTLRLICNQTRLHENLPPSRANKILANSITEP